MRYIPRVLFPGTRWYVYDSIYRRVVATDLTEAAARAEARRLNRSA